jgi:hypothetical protein
MEYSEAILSSDNNGLAGVIQSHFDVKSSFFKSIYEYVRDLEKALRQCDIADVRQSTPILRRLEELLQIDCKIVIEALQSDVIIEYYYEPEVVTKKRKKNRMHIIPKSLTDSSLGLDDGYDTSVL